MECHPFRGIDPASDPAPQRLSVFEMSLSGKILWDHEESKTQLSELYELAKQKSWNPSLDIDWCSSPGRDAYPILEDSNALRGFTGFDCLAEIDKRRIVWWQHGLEISEILHGEQAALIVAAQLVNFLPTMEGKLLAGSQVIDEAKHVEFFSRYLRHVAGAVHPPSDALRVLLEKTIQDPRWDIKFIICQLVIESLALARFQEIKNSSAVPLLRDAIDNITKDEARHVRFGTEILKEYLQELTPEELSKRSEYVMNTTLSLINSESVYVRIARRMGWEPPALRYHLRLHRLKNPQITRARLRLLVRNLGAVGLITTSVSQRLAEIDERA
jgi:hypothetical protein